MADPQIVAGALIGGGLIGQAAVPSAPASVTVSPVTP